MCSQTRNTDPAKRIVRKGFNLSVRAPMVPRNTLDEFDRRREADDAAVFTPSGGFLGLHGTVMGSMILHFFWKHPPPSRTR